MTVRISDQDREAIKRVVQSEIGGWKGDALNRGATLNVDTIINRAHIGKGFGGNSIEAVINHPQAFSAINGKGSWQALKPASKAVSDAVDARLDALRNGAQINPVTHFANPDISGKKALRTWVNPMIAKGGTEEIKVPGRGRHVYGVDPSMTIPTGPVALDFGDGKPVNAPRATQITREGGGVLGDSAKRSADALAKTPISEIGMDPYGFGRKFTNAPAPMGGLLSPNQLTPGPTAAETAAANAATQQRADKLAKDRDIADETDGAAIRRDQRLARREPTTNPAADPEHIQGPEQPGLLSRGLNWLSDSIISPAEGAEASPMNKFKSIVTKRDDGFSVEHKNGEGTGHDRWGNQVIVDRNNNIISDPLDDPSIVNLRKTQYPEGKPEYTMKDPRKAAPLGRLDPKTDTFTPLDMSSGRPRLAPDMREGGNPDTSTDQTLRSIRDARAIEAGNPPLPPPRPGLLSPAPVDPPAPITPPPSSIVPRTLPGGGQNLSRLPDDKVVTDAQLGRVPAGAAQAAPVVPPAPGPDTAAQNAEQSRAIAEQMRRNGIIPPAPPSLAITPPQRTMTMPQQPPQPPAPQPGLLTPPTPQPAAPDATTVPLSATGIGLLGQAAVPTITPLPAQPSVPQDPALYGSDGAIMPAAAIADPMPAPGPYDFVRNSGTAVTGAQMPDGSNPAPLPPPIEVATPPQGPDSAQTPAPAVDPLPFTTKLEGEDEAAAAAKQKADLAKWTDLIAGLTSAGQKFAAIGQRGPATLGASPGNAPIHAPTGGAGGAGSFALGRTPFLRQGSGSIPLYTPSGAGAFRGLLGQ